MAGSDWRVVPTGAVVDRVSLRRCSWERFWFGVTRVCSCCSYRFHLHRDYRRIWFAGWLGCYRTICRSCKQGIARRFSFTGSIRSVDLCRYQYLARAASSVDHWREYPPASAGWGDFTIRVLWGIIACYELPPSGHSSSTFRENREE